MSVRDIKKTSKTNTEGKKTENRQKIIDKAKIVKRKGKI